MQIFRRLKHSATVLKTELSDRTFLVIVFLFIYFIVVYCVLFCLLQPSGQVCSCDKHLTEMQIFVILMRLQFYCRIHVTAS